MAHPGPPKPERNKARTRLVCAGAVSALLHAAAIAGGLLLLGRVIHSRAEMPGRQGSNADGNGAAESARAFTVAMVDAPPSATSGAALPSHAEHVIQGEDTPPKEEAVPPAEQGAHVSVPDPNGAQLPSEIQEQAPPVPITTPSTNGAWVFPALDAAALSNAMVKIADSARATASMVTWPSSNARSEHALPGTMLAATSAPLASGAEHGRGNAVSAGAGVPDGGNSGGAGTGSSPPAGAGAYGGFFAGRLTAGRDNRSPRYPDESRRRGEEGTVRLRLVIAPDGRVQSASAMESSGFERLDAAAVEAACAWRFDFDAGERPSEACVALMPVGFLLKR